MASRFQYPVRNTLKSGPSKKGQGEFMRSPSPANFWRMIEETRGKSLQRNGTGNPDYCT